jgi:hypothetical protein
VNASMATVKDIVWKEGQDPTKDMPTAIMVEVDDYDGPLVPRCGRAQPLPRERVTRVNSS